MLIFDIGANIGSRATCFRNAYPDATVVCVEPVLQTFMRLPKYPWLIRVHAAVWKSPAIKPIWPVQQMLSWSSLYPEKWEKTKPGMKWSDSEQVACVTLDSLATAYGVPDYVKIDVEGCEREALLGMTFTPERLSFEFCNVYMQDALDCVRLLITKGYTKGAWIKEEWSAESFPDGDLADLEFELQRDNPRSGNILVKL
jgi:FkbM family methyltransferase